MKHDKQPNRKDLIHNNVAT